MKLHTITSPLVFVSLAVALASAQEREWRDVTFKHSVAATLREVGKDFVVLEKSNGDKLTVPLDKLSAADRDFVSQWNAPPPHLGIPREAITDEERQKYIAIAEADLKKRRQQAELKTGIGPPIPTTKTTSGATSKVIVIPATEPKDKQATKRKKKKSNEPIPSTRGVTYGNYLKLQTDMAMWEIENILGDSQTEMARAEFAGIKSVTYQWSSPAKTGVIMVILTDGKLKIKSQFGLK